MITAPPELDVKDQTFLLHRVAELDKVMTPRVGDYIDFADGVSRRISHVWNLDDGAEYQTSDGGSWYLGDGYCNFSGGLHLAVKHETLTKTDERRDGLVWFFHHDYWTAGNGVNASIPFRVYTCTEVAPS